MPLCQAVRRADRQCHRKTQGDCHVEIELSAHCPVGRRTTVAALGRENASEEGRADRAQIETRRADAGEPHRRQVPFPDCLGETPCCDFVDAEAGKGLQFAVSFDRAIIDIIVAKRAEVEAAERVVAGSSRIACMSIDPQRRVVQRQRTAERDACLDFGEERRIAIIRTRDQLCADPAFVIDRTQRPGFILVARTTLDREQLARPADILRAGEVLEADIAGDVGEQVERARRIVDLRLAPADGE